MQLVPAQRYEDAPSCPVVEIQVQGALDPTTVPRLRERLRDALTLRPGRLVVDLTGCTFLGAQGIHMLLDVHRQAWRQQSTLSLRGCGERHLRVLALMGLHHVFAIEGAAEA